MKDEETFDDAGLMEGGDSRGDEQGLEKGDYGKELKERGDAEEEFQDRGGKIGDKKAPDHDAEHRLGTFGDENGDENG